MEIHVVRHTPVDVEKNTCYGRLEVPLGESFEEDASEMRQFLPTDYDKVFTSPAKRCVDLVHALSVTDYQKENRLQELDFGAWEGKTWDAIDTEKLQLWMDDYVEVAPEKGESLIQMHTRIVNFIEELRVQDYEKVLLVAHAGVIRCLWAYFLDFPLKNIFRIPVNFKEHFVFNLGESSDLDSVVQLK